MRRQLAAVEFESLRVATASHFHLLPPAGAPFRTYTAILGPSAAAIYTILSRS